VPPPTEEGGEPGTGTPEEVLARADQLLQDAQDALEDSDLAGYQAKVDEATALIQQALGALEPTTTTEPPPAPASTAPASGG